MPPPSPLPDSSRPTPSARAGRVHRRTVMAGLAGLGAAALSGCESDSPVADPGEAGRTGTTPGPQGASPEELDEALARQVETVLADQIALLQRTLGTHPGLRGRLRPWIRVHREHQQALTRATPEQTTPAAPGSEGTPDPGSTAGTPSPTPVPARRRAALQQARSGTRAVQQRLGEAAVEAQSGAFARLLAAMAAGTGQQLAAQGSA